MTLISKSTFLQALDLSAGIDDVVIELKKHFEYDLDERRPGPAYLLNGELQPTDLDLASLLSTLAHRKAIVHLPTYKVNTTNGASKGAKVGQVLLSPNDRRGPITKLSSNQKNFGMSILVNDMNVVNTDAGGSLGAPRYFKIVGADTRWYPGWTTINVVPDENEKDFLAKWNLLVSGGVAFQHFVHPNQKFMIYSPYYTLAKICIDRLERQAAEFRASIKSRKVKLASGDKLAFILPKDDEKTSFAKVKVRVPSMETEVAAPFHGTFRDADDYTVDTLEDFVRRYAQDYLPALRFAVRVADLAFYKASGEKAGVPAYIKDIWSPGPKKGWRTIENPIGSAGVVTRLNYRIRAIEEEVAQATT